MTMFSRYRRNSPGTRVRASSTHFSNSWREMREELMPKLSALSPGPEEAVEVCRRRFRDRVERDALDLRELLRRLDDVSRLAGLSAVRDRSQERRVRLDEHRVERQAACG